MSGVGNAQSRGREATVWNAPAILGDQAASAESAQYGSERLLRALILYARHHHPKSDLASLEL